MERQLNKPSGPPSIDLNFPPNAVTLTPPRPHRANPKQSRSFSASPWKESLRARCLQRARHARQDAVKKARLRNTFDREPLDGKSDGKSSDTARDLISCEIQMSQTSSISSPVPLGRNFTTPPCLSSTVPRISYDGARNFRDELRPDVEEEALTEEDFLDLMREVEEELRRDEALIAMEVLEAEQYQSLDQSNLESMVEEYYNSNTYGNSFDTEISNSSIENMHQAGIVCPICQSHNLIQSSANVIFCPGSMNSEFGISTDVNSMIPVANPLTPRMSNPRAQVENSLSFASQSGIGETKTCLRLDRSADGMTLANLQNCILKAYHNHESLGCHGDIQFQMASRFGFMALIASCSQCSMDVMVA